MDPEIYIFCPHILRHVLRTLLLDLVQLLNPTLLSKIDLFVFVPVVVVSLLEIMFDTLDNLISIRTGKVLAKIKEMLQ